MQVVKSSPARLHRHRLDNLTAVFRTRTPSFCGLILMVNNVILTGFMGTGKSTVGRLLSQQLGLEFVDTDLLIEERSGLSISDIFRLQGESSFRRWEARIAQELAGRDGLVIATGGRLMLDPDNQAALSSKARVICLTAEPEEIISRLTEDESSRPLLDGPDPAGRIRELMARRAEGYGRFHQIDTTGKTHQHIVKEIVQCLSVT
jgi:shikimate kinase